MSTALHALTYLVQGTGSHDIVVNTDLDQVDKSLNGYLSQSVAGGVDVTLSATNWNNRLFTFTGTLTANINVIVPVTSRLFGVYNNTTGAFTLTVKTASGTGVTVSQGSRAIVACDGTNVVPFTMALPTGQIVGTKVLTDNSPINILSLTIASNSSVGGIIHYTIEATDGTDFQSETGSVYYNAVNKAGAVTVTINEVNSQQAVSAGTLVTTWAMSAANPSLVSINANTSLTPSTGYPRITFSVSNFGQQAIAVA